MNFLPSPFPPALRRLAKEGGEEGQKKIQRITRYTTVGLALLMGFAYYVMLKNYNLLPCKQPLSFMLLNHLFGI